MLTFQNGVTEAKSFSGHREILLQLFSKHVTPKPQRTFETPPKLDNPWNSDEKMDSDEKSENVSENSEFHFIRRLRQNQARKYRKRLAPSSPDLGSHRMSESDKRDSDSGREPKVLKSDSSNSEKKKIKKISWP
jgi:hypothetical protein